MDEQKTTSPYPQIHPMEIWMADLPRKAEGGPYGRRPVVIISIDSVGERTEFAPIIPLTSDFSFEERTSHAMLHADCLQAESRALCEHMTLVHKSRLVRCIRQIWKKFGRKPAEKDAYWWSLRQTGATVQGGTVAGGRGADRSEAL